MLPQMLRAAAIAVPGLSNGTPTQAAPPAPALAESAAAARLAPHSSAKSLLNETLQINRRSGDPAYQTFQVPGTAPRSGAPGRRAPGGARGPQGAERAYVLFQTNQTNRVAAANSERLCQPAPQRV